MYSALRGEQGMPERPRFQTRRSTGRSAGLPIRDLRKGPVGVGVRQSGEGREGIGPAQGHHPPAKRRAVVFLPTLQPHQHMEIPKGQEVPGVVDQVAVSDVRQLHEPKETLQSPSWGFRLGWGLRVSRRIRLSRGIRVR